MRSHKTKQPGVQDPGAEQALGQGRTAAAAAAVIAAVATAAAIIVVFIVTDLSSQSTDLSETFHCSDFIRGSPYLQN